MATRSNIAIQLPDGMFKQIYCHWDGYYSYNGAILLHHYKTTEKIMALIDGGDISSLGEEVVTEGEHSFSKPAENRTVYYKDRGEDCPARIMQYPSKDENYLYVWMKDVDGEYKWFATTYSADYLKPLTEGMVKSQA